MLLNRACFLRLSCWSPLTLGSSWTFAKFRSRCSAVRCKRRARWDGGRVTWGGGVAATWQKDEGSAEETQSLAHAWRPRRLAPKQTFAFHTTGVQRLNWLPWKATVWPVATPPEHVNPSFIQTHVQVTERKTLHSNRDAFLSTCAKTKRSRNATWNPNQSFVFSHDPILQRANFLFKK